MPLHGPRLAQIGRCRVEKSCTHVSRPGLSHVAAGHLSPKLFARGSSCVYPMKMFPLLFTMLGIGVATVTCCAASANDAILRYLGEPVSAPPNLAAKYTVEGIESAFRALCEQHGVKIKTLTIDRSEFPFLVYGRLEGGREFFRQIDSHLKALPGYSYAGSVGGGSHEGVTVFSLNMIPTSEYPREHVEAIRRRQMVRLQMLAQQAGSPTEVKKRARAHEGCRRGECAGKGARSRRAMSWDPVEQKQAEDEKN